MFWNYLVFNVSVLKTEDRKYQYIMNSIGVGKRVTDVLRHLCIFFGQGKEGEFTTNKFVIINQQQELLTTFVRRFVGQESLLNVTGAFRKRDS